MPFLIENCLHHHPAHQVRGGIDDILGTVEDEGFDPQSDEYYTELDRRIADTFGGNAKTANRRPAQTVAGVSRSNSGRSSGKKVRLTPSQVAIAKKLGVPLEEYAKYVKE